MLLRPRADPGAIGLEDSFFLTAFASILAPRRVVELGTLTGFSAALLGRSSGSSLWHLTSLESTPSTPGQNA